MVQNDVEALAQIEHGRLILVAVLHSTPRLAEARAGERADARVDGRTREEHELKDRTLRRALGVLEMIPLERVIRA